MTPLTCDQVAGLLAAGRLAYRPQGYSCLERYQADVNPDRATAQTIGVMCRQIREAISTSIVQRTAQRAVEQWRGGPLYARLQFDANDERMIACSIWFEAKHSVKFQEHAEQIKALLNEVDQRQLLIRPDVLLGMRQPAGDCAVFTPLICAMLGALSTKYEIVTIACDPREPELFSHVSPRAVTNDGHYIPLDASHGRYPGWEVPRAHQIRRQVWSADGEPIEDAAPPVARLGQYWRRPPVHRVWPRRLGMGQVDSNLLWDVPSNSYGDFPVTDTNAVDPSLAPPGTSVTTLNYPGMPSPASSTSTPFDWNRFFAGAVTQGINLAGKVVAPQTTLIRGPGGQLFYQTPAGTTTPAPLTTALLGTSGGGNRLLIGGAIVLGLIAVSVLSKK